MILCSARNSESIRSAFKYLDLNFSVNYLPFPFSIPAFLVQKFLDIRLRNYSNGLTKSVILKIFLKEIPADLTFRTPYFYIFFKLYLVNINLNSGKLMLSQISESNFYNLIFSRTSLCEIQNKHYDLGNRYFRRMEREGIESPILAIKKIVESGILIWRIGSPRQVLTLFQADKFLLEKGESREIFDTSNQLGDIDIIELEDGIVSRGLYVEKGEVIYPTSTYYEKELSQSFSCVSPFYGKNGKIMTFAPNKDIALDSAVFGGFNSNYYHFTWEIAPRLIAFFEEHKEGNVPIILNRQAPNSLIEFAKEISGLDPILLGDDEKTCVKNLYLIFDGRYETQVDYKKNTHSNIFESRRQDLSRIRKVADRIHINISPPDFRKIFIGRPEYDYRVPSNYDIVRESLCSNSFEEIKIESFSLKEQISMFRNAEEICIITGAAATNLVYCHNLKKLVFLVIDQSPPFLVFWQEYCEFLGLNATFLYSKNSRDRYGPLNIDELISVLK